MANYKGLTFPNTLEGFKSWSKEFPPLDADAVKQTGYKKAGDYYLELQLVKGFITNDAFIGTNVREYDHETKDFNYVGMEKEKELLETVFRNKVIAFENKWLGGNN